MQRDIRIKLIKTADDSIASSIGSFLKDLIDPEKPGESFVKLLAEGAIFKANPFLGICLEILKAFGLDYTKLISGLYNGLKDIIIGKDLKNVDENKVLSIAQSAAESAMTGKIDKEKLVNLKSELEKNPQLIPDMISMVAQAEKNINNTILIKNAGLVSSAASFFIKHIFGYIWRGFLMAAIGAGASKLIGKKDEKSSSEKGDGSTQDLPKHKYITIELSKNMPQEMLATHSNMWNEKFDISEINQKLKEWSLIAYPQLKNYVSFFDRSPTFNKMEEIFKDLNEKHTLSSRGYTFFPTKYKNKLEIINTFINEVVDLILSSAKK